MAQTALQQGNTAYLVNPTTGAVISEYTLQSKGQAAKVIDAAHAAYLLWREVDIKERAEAVRRIGALLQKHKEELAALMTQQMGKPIEQSRGEVDLCAMICEYSAKEGPGFLQDEKHGFAGGKGIVTYQPIGVLLAIEPWNFPLYQVIRYSIPNLVVGNASVLKHAQCVWGVAERIAEIYEEAGVPKGVLSLLFTDDETTSDLIAHDKIRGVTLTGSVRAGSAVAERAGKHLKKVVLELGGSDPYIILGDAPIDDIIDTCVLARTLNSGQTCICAKRFIVVESVYEAFRNTFVEAMKATHYGDPMNPENAMGPMARQDLRDGLHKQVQESIQNGAICTLGGTLPESDGYYYPATVLEYVKPGMPAYDDELFGPVASLIKVKDEEEAIRIANDHKYGLGGGIFTADTQRGIDIARTRIESGMVNVNGYNIVQPNLPFGGTKDSGFGREHGEYGFHEFVNIKTVMVAE